MDGEMEIEEQVDISMLFKLLVNQGVAARIRTGEQVQMGKTMQIDTVLIGESKGEGIREDFTI